IGPRRPSDLGLTVSPPSSDQTAQREAPVKPSPLTDTRRSPRGFAGSAPVALTPLTGRNTEVSLLADRWEQAQEGMGQVVLIVGEPGLGKSRLVHTIKQLVTEQGHAKVGAAKEIANASQDCSVVEWRCSLRFQDTSLFSVSDYFSRLLNLADDES